MIGHLTASHLPQGAILIESPSEFTFLIVEPQSFEQLPPVAMATFEETAARQLNCHAGDLTWRWTSDVRVTAEQREAFRGRLPRARS